MILVLAYIINLFAPIINPVGGFGLIACIVYDDLHILGVAGPCAIAGAIFGILAYRNDIPPRWSWAKSKNDIFRFSISAVLGYAVSVAMWPCAIYLVTLILELAALQ